jgi:hypothetical protein
MAATQKQKTATSTPRSRKAAIGTATVAGDSLVLKLSNPSADPFARQILAKPKDVKARLTLDDGTVKGPFTKQFAGQPVELLVPLTAKEAAGLRRIEVWGEPYGYVAVRDPDAEKALAVGRLTIDVVPLPTGVSPKVRTRRVEVLKGVVPYIVGEMVAHAKSDAIADIRKSILLARDFDKEAATRMEQVGKNIWTVDMDMNIAMDMVHAAKVQRASAYAAFGLLEHTGGQWDHKTVIPAVWGNWNRLGDSALVYYYDTWSNLHFSYVGRAAGFSLKDLHWGSDLQQIVDSGKPDEPADYNAIEEGFAMYTGKEVTIDALLALVATHVSWTEPERRKAWALLGIKK